MSHIRTILHPTDFSESSHLAFRLACSVAGDHGARLHVLHVGRQPIISPVEGSTEPGCYREELMEKLHALTPSEPRLPGLKSNTSSCSRRTLPRKSSGWRSRSERT
jgi:nucleotide-binding universal stress UspA family protein